MGHLKNYIPQTVYKLIWAILYVLLIAAPKASEIKQHANQNQGELLGRSLFFVLVSETAFRAGIFLIIGFTTEQLLGNEIYEKYQLDYMFFWLLFVGAIHILTFYLGKGVLIRSNESFALFICRLGRNSAYAILPAFIMVGYTLFFQYREQTELFSGVLVQVSFFITWVVFVFLGIQEAMLKHLFKSSSKPLD